MAIPRDLRLKKNKDFQIVRKEGVRRVYPFFITQLKSESDQACPSKPSLGVVAARRVGNAVIRNRGKRIIRNLFLKHIDLLPAGSQLVVVLRVGFDKETSARLEKDFVNACNWFNNSRK
jgi:ribonuclease P protein component